MDLILTIVMLFSVAVIKNSSSHTSVMQASFTDERGVIQETVVEEQKLVVGKNLMLKREPRAFHKILDEMGLGGV